MNPSSKEKAVGKATTNVHIVTFHRSFSCGQSGETQARGLLLKRHRKPMLLSSKGSVEQHPEGEE